MTMHETANPRTMGLTQNYPIRGMCAVFPLFTPSHEAAEERGTHVCVQCGFAFNAERLDDLPECPNCGESRFRTASIFAPTVVERTDLTGEHEWLAEARAGLHAGASARISYRDGETVHVLPLSAPVTRIGRSPTAHVRLDDPTVSRRHAMICDNHGALELIDDRSLNGVYLNGERVEHAALADGDEIVVGSFHLFVIEP